MESEDTLEGEEKEKRNGLLLAGNLNLAMCCLKLNQDHEALQYCDKALELDPKNEKGLFRRATVSGNYYNIILCGIPRNWHQCKLVLLQL